MRPKSVEGRSKEIFCFLLNLAENESKIGRGPIKGGFLFLIKFGWKWARNRPKADQRRFFIKFGWKWALNRPKADKRTFYVFYLIMLKNEPKIGRRPIEGDRGRSKEFFCFKQIMLKNGFWAHVLAKFIQKHKTFVYRSSTDLGLILKQN
jgi:hypothetical protein